MKKTMLLRGLFGFPVGISIGYLITVCTSLIWGGGYYTPCVPELVSMMGNEIRAVLLQTLLCGLIGTGCAAGSVIWEVEHWSIAKQTGLYFLVISVIVMPISYLLHWMEHSMAGFLQYYGIFAAIFAVIWITEFLIGKRNVDKMNQNLYKAKDEL